MKSSCSLGHRKAGMAKVKRQLVMCAELQIVHTTQCGCALLKSESENRIESKKVKVSFVRQLAMCAQLQMVHTTQMQISYVEK